MNNLIKVAQFLRVVDENEQISVTNIALFIVLYKLCVTPTTSITDVGSLIIALGGYNYKKYINRSTAIGSMVASINPDVLKDKND